MTVACQVSERSDQFVADFGPLSFFSFSDCNEISLKYAGDREILKLDPELCSYAPFSLATVIFHGYFSLNIYYRNYSQAQPRSLVKLVQNLAFLEQGKPVSKSDKELCQRILDSDIAIVTVQLESKSFQKWSRSPRVSFFDKLSYIGINKLIN